jgi:hypothetical protein
MNRRALAWAVRIAAIFLIIAALTSAKGGPLEFAWWPASWIPHVFGTPDETAKTWLVILVTASSVTFVIAFWIVLVYAVICAIQKIVAKRPVSSETP